MSNIPTDLRAFIFCRGGSKGIPKKNIQSVAGKPLLSYAVASALGSKYICEVVVSTDCEEIAAVAEEAGASVLLRPDELATDKAPELLAWKHAIESYRDDLSSVFISLPATSPLRIAEDVDMAIEEYFKGYCDIVFGISPSHRSPYLNMVEVDADGLIEVINKREGLYRRQDVPDVYDITTCVYVGEVEYILGCSSLMQGKVGYVEIPAERALDIDTPYDLYLADLILKHPFPKTAG